MLLKMFYFKFPHQGIGGNMIHNYNEVATPCDVRELRKENWDDINLVR